MPGILSSDHTEFDFMVSRHQRPSHDGYRSVEQEFDALILRLRRLAGHRGYKREALVSPMLQRLMPLRKLSGDPSTDMEAFRVRLTEARLDRKAVAYLTESAETELDFARLRLT